MVLVRDLNGDNSQLRIKYSIEASEVCSSNIETDILADVGEVERSHPVINFNFDVHSVLIIHFFDVFDSGREWSDIEATGGSG